MPENKQSHVKSLLLLLLLLVLFVIIQTRTSEPPESVEPVPWNPSLVTETAHYKIFSTASKPYTTACGNVAESLYLAHRQLLGQLPGYLKTHHLLKLKVYASREEMRAANGITGWYEAFYKAPYCHQYLDVGNRNPYHWMIHEATHQLNHEVAQLKLRRWINEGLACYFGVSTLKAHGINAGTVDPAAYPIWWYPRIRLSGDKARDIRKKRFIPLKNILMDNNNPDIDKHFNLYYIHWHSLVHYLINYQNGKHLKGFYKVLENGGSMRSFHEQIGELNVIEDQWYNHLIELKKEVKDLQKKRDSQRREDFKKLGKEQYNKENVGNPTPK